MFITYTYIIIHTTMFRKINLNSDKQKIISNTLFMFRYKYTDITEYIA